MFTPRLDQVAGESSHFAGKARLHTLLDVLNAVPSQDDALVTPGGSSEGWTLLGFAIADEALTARSEVKTRTSGTRPCEIRL